MSVSQPVACEQDTLVGRDFALLIIMNLIWGLNLIASKIGVGQFPPIFLTALRFGSLALLLLPMLKVHRGQMGYLLGAALLTGPGAFALLFLGISLVKDVSAVA
ncbi:MAG TPA: EamA family transporter, partial [Steroidobacter sp.]|nr:EamA family transporter [Steroidobacter sp.]